MTDGLNGALALGGLARRGLAGVRPAFAEATAGTILRGWEVVLPDGRYGALMLGVACQPKLASFAGERRMVEWNRVSSNHLSEPSRAEEAIELLDTLEAWGTLLEQSAPYFGGTSP